MSQNLFNRYIWMVDTIRRRGRISRRELNECWLRSPLSEGRPLARRTFYNYREAIQDLFNIDIKCDPSSFEYYIEMEQDGSQGSISDWLLNNAAVNDLLTNSQAVADRIFVEDVPSAREHLAPVIDALRENKPIRFDYLPYSRTIPTVGLTLEPYFLKIFRQRWYITGRRVDENKIKTYALDRMSHLQILPDTFEPDPTFDPKEYFRYSFGIVFTQSEVKHIVIRTDARQAKYFRALPLHHTQEETIHDDYSIFYYRMRISPDLVDELMSYGSRITVLEPPELRAMMRSELEAALKTYKN